MYKTKQQAKENLDFLAMIAHDLKTPVKAQIRAMNLLYSGIYGEVSSEMRNLILNIIASNKYLQCLVDNILGDYRIKCGKFSLVKSENDFRKTLEEVLCNIGILSEVKGQTIEINYLSDNFLKTYDDIEIQRVVMNLLSNAFEYGRENSAITINISSNNKGIEFEIQSEFKSRIDAQDDVYKKQLKSNCGLGFIICSKIIFAHKGIFKKPLIEEGVYKTGFILP